MANWLETMMDESKGRLQLMTGKDVRKPGVMIPVDKGIQTIMYNGQTLDMTFKEAYEFSKEMQPDMLDYGIYAGRYVKILEERMEPENLDDILEAFGLPTPEEIKSDSRFLSGVEKVATQVLYGASKGAELFGAEERVDVQKGRKENVKRISEEEQIWKAYNAGTDDSSSSGLDLPFNVTGGLGESVPYVVAGFGAGAMYAKAGSQMVAGIAADTAIDTARYAEHGSGTQLAADMLGTVGGSVLGLKLGNLVQPSGSMTSKADLTPEQLYTSSQAMGLLSDGKVRANPTVIGNPQKAGDIITSTKNPYRVKAMTKGLTNTSEDALYTYSNALNSISPREWIGKDVPSNELGNPLGYKLRQYYEGIEQSFNSQAKPFETAYRSVGDDIKMNVEDIMLSAGSELRNKNARAHIQSAINQLKKRETPESKLLNKQVKDIELRASALDTRIKKAQLAEANAFKDIDQGKAELEAARARYSELMISDTTHESAILVNEARQKKLETQIERSAERARAYGSDVAKGKQLQLDNRVLQDKAEAADLFDIKEITANDLDDVIMQINQDVFAGSGQFQGTITPAADREIKGWLADAKGKLANVNPSFSTPYAKNKAIHAEKFKIVGGDSPIDGLAPALKDKTNKQLSQLFTGKHGQSNLAKLGQTMPSDHPLYGAAVRNHIEDKIPQEVLVQQGVGKTNQFGFKHYSKEMAGYDFEQLQRIAGSQSKDAIGELAGLKGLGDALAYEGDILTSMVARDKMLSQVETGSALKKPVYAAQEIYDFVGEKIGFAPWWKETDARVSNALSDLLDRTQAPDQRMPLWKGPASERTLYDQQLNMWHIKQGSIPDVDTSGSMLQMLGDPEFKYTPNKID